MIPTMNINEVRKVKNELEIKMTIEIAKLAEKFENKTGMSIERIRVNFIETTNMGDPRPKFTIGSCEVDVERI